MEFTAVATWLNTAFAGFDNAILEFMHTLEEAAGGILTPLASFITLIGEKGLLMFALAFVFMLFSRTRKLGICLFGAVCCGALITNIILKDLIARPRPFEAMAPFLKYWKAVGSPAEDGFSFPSGHVTAAAAGMSAIMFVKGKKWILPSALYVFLMCFSRNYLMAHYPSDVLAASVVGLFSGLVAYLIGSFIWEYIDDNDDLPFFSTLKYFSLPLPDMSGVKKKLNRVPAEGSDKKRQGKAGRSARAERGSGRHSAAAPQGRHSAAGRHAAPAVEEIDFALEEDIDLALDESLEEEVHVNIDDDDTDAYDALVKRSAARERSGSHEAVRKERTGIMDAVRSGKTGSHQAVRTGSHEAVRSSRTGSHEAVRTGSHEAVRTERTGSHQTVSARRGGAKTRSADNSGKARGNAAIGGILSAAKAKMPAVKAPAALRWRAEQSAAEKAAAAAPKAETPAEPAPAAPKARSTSDWNARWEEYQARKEKAQVKTAPAAPGSVQMEFENRFAPADGDEDMKIAPEKPARQFSVAQAPAESQPASPVQQDTVNDAPVQSGTGVLEVPAQPAEASVEEPKAEEKLLSPRKPAKEEEAPKSADGALFAPPPEKAEATPPESVEIDMSEFYSLLDGSYDFSRD